MCSVLGLPLGSAEEAAQRQLDREAPGEALSRLRRCVVRGLATQHPHHPAAAPSRQPHLPHALGRLPDV